MTAYIPGDQFEAEDAVAVFLHFYQHPSRPLQVVCPSCDWQDGDGQFSRIAVEGDRVICPDCHGTGWQTISKMEESPWVIDSFTVDLAKIHMLWW